MSETRKILLLEDDRHIALALQIRLSAAGFSVMVAGTVAQANGLVTEQVPDIAVIDVNLPDGNGIAFMQSLNSLCPGIPIMSIIMSASRRSGLVEEAIEAGAWAFLEKPFPSSMLLEAVSSAGPVKRAS